MFKQFKPLTSPILLSKGVVAGRRPLVLYVCLAVASIYRAQSQSETNSSTNATTVAYEADALNSIFSKWEITDYYMAQWNTTADPCSGEALGSDPTIDDTAYNPFIKCDCSFLNSTTCHITALKVYALDVSGPIPDELWTLSHLTSLNLGQNVLTGNLSSSIRNLTRMQWLTFGINSLSGEVPKELGLLSDLRSLAISSNKFSGPLPSSLGNLIKLQQLYIDSSGVSGVIPLSFANLRNLETVWASDVEFTGTIPDFIGNWSSLQTLRLEGSSLQGPIPSAISNLTSLTELRISDISNGNSSLGFIKNMKSLTTLVLRNVKISDVIPSHIGEFQNLTQLDLSFNNINGQIPDSLFNLSSLSYLFLGNNKLNGTLPSLKSSSLTNIDVSYNNLGGSLPSWVNQQNLQLNLIANNFTIDQKNTSGLPSGLACLQRGFTCRKDPPVYSEFAIKCGYQQMTSSSDIVYESDNETLGPATYHVTDAKTWGVSNVGYFTGSNNPRNTVASSSQFTNTMDPELFQTARISASSLRYYGLGLENGKYTILLQFAETAIENGNTWKSLGRRVFDVYIQGSRVLKDFDIRQETGGTSFQAVQKSFNANVTENYLDIHFLWAGKGTCCIPTQGTYGPLISAISARSDFSSENSKTGLIVGIAVGVGSLCFAFGLLVYVAIERRKRRLAFVDKELQGIDTKPYIFSHTELKASTEDFSPANKLGEGGFGSVYKGQLKNGRVVAVKQLLVASRQGKSQFVTEIATISAVQHRNLVKLHGCCIEGDNRLLVYEYLENKSLDQALFGEHCLDLDWATRYKICLGVAKGLAYLHEESRLRIVHRDVKASNILLDSNLVPKISDFGLAKLYDDKKTHISTRVAGTIGYLSPEYAMRGHLTEKADVFSYGVVVLEVISGRPNSDSSLEEEKIYLLEWAWNLHEQRQEVDLVDSRLSEYNAEEVKRLIDVALLCTQTSPAVRPTMSRVVGMVCGDIEVESVTAKPGYLTDWQFQDISSSFMTDIASIPSEETSYRNSFTSTTILQPNSTLPSPASPTHPMLY